MSLEKKFWNIFMFFTCKTELNSSLTNFFIYLNWKLLLETLASSVNTMRELIRKHTRVFYLTKNHNFSSPQPDPAISEIILILKQILIIGLMKIGE